MNLKYLFGSVVAFPLLPIMYFQGKRIRKSVPVLPEAKEPTGLIEVAGTKPFNLLVLGESSMAGVGAKTHSEAFGGSLAKDLQQHLKRSINWEVNAKSGYTVARLIYKIIPKLDASKTYDLIVIGMGGNDAFTLNTPARWRKQIRDLIRSLQVKFPDTPIVFSNMPPIKEFPAFTPIIQFTIGNLVNILGEELNKVTKEFNQVYYYARTITIKDWKTRLSIEAPVADFFSDGVHPSTLTYQTWGKDLAQFILNKNLFN